MKPQQLQENGCNWKSLSEINQIQKDCFLLYVEPRFKLMCVNRVWWHTPVILALGRWKRDQEFKASLIK